MRFRRSFILYLFFSLFVCTLLIAQTDDSWYYNKPIKNITFEGLKNLSSIDIDGVTSSFIGKDFSDATYSDLLNRIYALDYFEDISTIALPANEQKTAVKIVFTVKEHPPIKDIIYKGNKQLNVTELKEVVSLKKGDVYVSAKALIDERKIRDFYLTKGFTNIRVSSEIEETPDGVLFQFNIVEGASTIITLIKFQGNEVIAEKTLKSELSLKENSLLNKGAFQESQLEADKTTILNFYKTRGYVDADITDVVRETFFNQEKGRDELTLTFIVKEGSQYTYEGIEISGNTVFSTETLSSLMKLKEGVIFNLTKYDAGIAAIADMYYENGYTSNVINDDLVRNTEKRTILCKLTIVEFPRSHIESIIVRGNSKTKDYVILRELPMESGDIFSKKNLMNGLRNLYNTQFFKAITPDFIPGSEQNLINMVVSVEEGSTVTVEFGVTFSGVEKATDMPVSAFVKWADSNVGGIGKTISTKFSLSGNEQAVDLGYTDSWLFGLPVTFSANINFTHKITGVFQRMYLPTSLSTDFYYMDYAKWSYGLNLSLGKRWMTKVAILTLTGGVGSTLLRNDYDSLEYFPVDDVLNDYHNTWGLEDSVFTNLSLDNRDVYYDPTQGWFTSQKLTWIGFFPTLESQFYLQSDTKGEIYFKLCDIPFSETWSLQLVLAGYTGLSFQIPAPGKVVGPNNALYIDGMFNGRGWQSLYGEKGNAMWSSNIELRMPIAKGIAAVDLWADAVVLKSNISTLFTNTTINDFKFSFGPGFRFSLVQFPIRLLLANTFKFENYEFQWVDNWKFTLSFNLANR